MRPLCGLRAKAAEPTSPRGALGSQEGPSPATSRHYGSRGFCLFGGTCGFSKCTVQNNPAKSFPSENRRLCHSHLREHRCRMLVVNPWSLPPLLGSWVTSEVFKARTERSCLVYVMPSCFGSRITACPSQHLSKGLWWIMCLHLSTMRKLFPDQVHFFFVVFIITTLSCTGS